MQIIFDKLPKGALPVYDVDGGALCLSYDGRLIYDPKAVNPALRHLTVPLTEVSQTTSMTDPLVCRESVAATVLLRIREMAEKAEKARGTVFSKITVIIKTPMISIPKLDTGDHVGYTVLLQFGLLATHQPLSDGLGLPVQDLTLDELLKQLS